MRKLFLIALVATALILDTGVASARHRGGCGGGCEASCGGRRHGGHRRHRGCNTCAPACASCGAPAGCASCALGGAGDGAYAMLGEEMDDLSATMVVDLPEDAVLMVDGSATASTSSSRTLETPPLEPGKSFTYTLTAQVTRDGITQTVTRQVTVRSGEETRVSLELPATAVVAR